MPPRRPGRRDPAPRRTVQIDIVFGENLPISPEPLTVLGAPVIAATAPFHAA